jgi:hypothetical protein
MASSAGGRRGVRTMTEEPTLTIERRRERSAHAIYGLIIVTAALVADRELAHDALTALVTVWGAGLVLLSAHVYSALVGEVDTTGRLPSYAERHVLVADNLPLLTSVVVPTVLLVAAGLGLIDLDLAIGLSIAVAIGALFAVGTYQAARSGASMAMCVVVGAIGAGLGVAVILLEVLLAH